MDGDLPSALSRGRGDGLQEAQAPAPPFLGHVEPSGVVAQPGHDRVGLLQGLRDSDGRQFRSVFPSGVGVDGGGESDEHRAGVAEAAGLDPMRLGDEVVAFGVVDGLTPPGLLGLGQRHQVHSPLSAQPIDQLNRIPMSLTRRRRTREIERSRANLIFNLRCRSGTSSGSNRRSQPPRRSSIRSTSRFRAVGGLPSRRSSHRELTKIRTDKGGPCGVGGRHTILQGRYAGQRLCGQGADDRRACCSS